jgi:hypothetical protein
MINDRDNKIKRLTNDNEVLKDENTKLNGNNNYLNSAIEAYKKHILVMTEQNDKLSQELEAILSRDAQLMHTLGRSNHLRAVEEENKNVINCSLDSLKAHIQNFGNIGNKVGNSINNSQINNKTYFNKYSINNNKNNINISRNNIDQEMNRINSSIRTDIQDSNNYDDNQINRNNSIYNSQEQLINNGLGNNNQQYFEDNQYSGGEEEQQYSGGEEEQQYSGGEEEQQYSGGEEEQQYFAGEDGNEQVEQDDQGNQ